MGKSEAFKDGPQWEDEPDEPGLNEVQTQFAKTVLRCHTALKVPNHSVNAKTSAWIADNEADFAAIALVIVANYNEDFAGLINEDITGWNYDPAKVINEMLELSEFVIPSSE